MKISRSRFWKYPVIQILIAVELFILAGMAAVALSAKARSSQIVTFTQNTAALAESGNRPYVTFTIQPSKICVQIDGTVGAEYDGILFNDTNHPFSEWRIKAKVPEGYKIDSSWAGRFLNGADYITILPHPEGYNRIVQPKESVSFGLVMYTPAAFAISDITFTGYFTYSILDEPFFIILLVLLIITALLLVVFASAECAAKKKIRIETEQYRKQHEHDSDMIDQACRTFANFVDAKDPYTKGHSVRVARYAQEISRRLGFDEEQQREMYYMGLMHDSGKVAIPDSILDKQAPLTPEERKIIEKHTTCGAAKLSDFSSMPSIKDIALYHHEKYDGSGYPCGLAGAAIPLSARIVCIADSYDAMASDRCYRPKFPAAKIKSELEQCAGTQFDPSIVNSVISMIDDGFTSGVTA